MTYEEWLAQTGEGKLKAIQKLFGDAKEFYEACVAETVTPRATESTLGPAGRPKIRAKPASR